jgi:hypothetical protein
MYNMLLEIVVVFHAFVMALHVVLPFSQSTAMILMHVVVASGQLSHWVRNDDTCFLSQLEASIRGCHLNDTLFNSFFAPIYQGLWQTQIIVAFLLLISCIRLLRRLINNELHI